MNRSYSKIRHIQEANIRLEKRLLREQTDVRNMITIYECAGLDGEASNEIHMDEFNELVSDLFDACDSFQDGDWDEDKIVAALERANSSTASGAQKILTCAFPKMGLKLQDNNPLLTVCRMAFTTTVAGMGFTDLGDSALKQRAQKALLKFGIKTQI